MRLTTQQSKPIS